MKQILVELEDGRDVAQQMGEVQETWASGHYRDLLIHVYSGLDQEACTTQVAKALAHCLPEAKVVGTMSAGEIKDGRLMKRGVLIAATFFETTEVRLLRYDNVRGDEEAVGERIREELDSIPEIQAAEMVFPGTEVDTRPLFEAISRCDRHIKIFGGYSGGHMLNAPTHYSFDASSVTSDSVVVVCLVGPDLHVDMDKAIGWEALGLPFVVTKASGNRLIELDGRPAAEVYERFLIIDRSSQDNAKAGYTFPLMTEYKGDSWLRSTIHIEEDGSLDLHGFVTEGTQIQLSYGNPLTIVDEVNKRLKVVRQFQPQVIWLYSCIVRKAFWDSFVDMEIEPFQTLASTSGFHTWGEVIRNETTNEVVEHNVTLLSVAMREGPAPDTDLVPEAQVDVSVLQGPAAQLMRLSSMVRTTMGELQKAHNDLRAMNDKLRDMNEKLQEMAEKDSLTKLYSRGKTEEIIRKTLEEATKNQPASLIMVDVDHFKRVNDVYGHHAGDLVLQRLAELFQDTVADHHGAAGRWGGEEFFLVLPNTEWAEAHATAETLRKRAEAEHFEDVGQVTISLGLITTKGDLDNKLVFSKVDDALYQAKRTGRNRTVRARLA